MFSVVPLYFTAHFHVFLYIFTEVCWVLGTLEVISMMTDNVDMMLTTPRGREGTRKELNETQLMSHDGCQ